MTPVGAASTTDVQRRSSTWIFQVKVSFCMFLSTCRLHCQATSLCNSFVAKQRMCSSVSKWVHIAEHAERHFDLKDPRKPSHCVTSLNTKGHSLRCFQRKPKGPGQPKDSVNSFQHLPLSRQPQDSTLDVDWFFTGDVTLDWDRK